MTARMNLYRRLNGETLSLTLEVPASDGKVARHPLDASFMRLPTGELWEICLRSQGKVGHGLDLVLHDLGVKLSRILQNRNPDTGEPIAGPRQPASLPNPPAAEVRQPDSS